LIYAIRAEGTEYIKFGVAADIKQRIDLMQTGCPFRLVLVASCPGGKGEETSVHVRLLRAKAHHRGEWFKDCPEAQAIIQEMRERTLLTKPAQPNELLIANRRIRLKGAIEERQRGGWKGARAAFPSRARVKLGVAGDELLAWIERRRAERLEWWESNSPALHQSVKTQ
jgi:hypothetical protein